MKRWAIALVLLSATVAYAQSKWVERPVRVDWSRGAPKVSFSAMELADKRVRSALTSGLRKRLVISVDAYRAGSNSKIVTRAFSCAVTRDLWDEGFVVRIGQRTEKVADLKSVLNRCLVVNGLFVGEPGKYERHRERDIYFAVTAQFNPISAKQCRELIKPSGGDDDPIGPITINIVRRRICQAEREVTFRSRVFQVPP